MVRFGAVLLVSFVLLVGTAAADDLEDEPFALRLLFSLERASNFASTLGLQAAAAEPGEASMNPAGDASRDWWGPDATVSSVNAFSTSGAWMTALFGHGSFSPGENDRLSFAYAHTWTVDGDSTGNFENEFGSDELYLRYSLPIGDRTTFGAELRYIFANLREESIPVELGFPARAETDISGPDLTLGVQTPIDETLTIGFMAGFGLEWTRTRVENLIPLPVPGQPGLVLPIGSELDSFRSKVLFMDLRGGVSLEVNPTLSLLADIQYLDYDIQDLARADTFRFFGGAKISVSDAAHVYLGGSADVEGQFTASAGVAYAFSDAARLALSYQYNAFPEVRQEFGRFEQLTLSFTLRF